jgi:hypothetical protein
MKIPPFLAAAAVLFWGWQTGLLIVAAIMALLVEGSRLIRVKYDFSTSDFNRISNLCNVTLIVLLFYFVMSERSTYFMVLVLAWLPLVVFPIVLAQAFSASQGIDLEALFLTYNKKKKHVNAKNRRLVDLSYPYVMLCILAAGAANVRDIRFYLCLLILSAWMLWVVRPIRYSPVVWAGLFILASTCGFWGQMGLNNLQKLLEQKSLEWFSDFRSKNLDPYRIRTAIGDVGELKLSDQILLRVWPEPGQKIPLLLREASYNMYQFSTWLAYQPAYTALSAISDGMTWNLKSNPDGRKRTVTLGQYFEKGQGMLNLPMGAFRIAKLPVEKMEWNQLGAVKVSEGPKLATYSVDYSPESHLDRLPDKADMLVPETEASVITKIVRELELAGKTPRAVLDTVVTYFSEKFTYALYQPQPDEKDTPLADFLLESKAGHCEFFATATVLILRSAGVPARYATGYMVNEFSPREKGYIVRERHAHAWALVYVNGRWYDFDTTPPAWLELEAQGASFLKPLFDWVSHIGFKIARWRQLEKINGLQRFLIWMLIPIFFIMLYKLHLKKKKKAVVPVKAKLTRARLFPGMDSDFYLIMDRLNTLGYYKPHGEPLSGWIDRTITKKLSDEGKRRLFQIVSLHCRYRFDPAGLDEQEKADLKAAVHSWLARYHISPMSVR